MKTMKVKRFAFTTSAFKYILSPGVKCYEVIKNHIPKDAEIVRIFSDPLQSTADTIYIDCISDEFEDAPEGKFLKPHAVQVKEHHGKLKMMQWIKGKPTETGWYWLYLSDHMLPKDASLDFVSCELVREYIFGVN
jgi:hypothetical protein